jgi:hypothetical protein
MSGKEEEDIYANAVMESIKLSMNKGFDFEICMPQRMFEILASRITTLGLVPLHVADGKVFIAISSGQKTIRIEPLKVIGKIEYPADFIDWFRRRYCNDVFRHYCNDLAVNMSIRAGGMHKILMDMQNKEIELTIGVTVAWDFSKEKLINEQEIFVMRRYWKAIEEALNLLYAEWRNFQ